MLKIKITTMLMALLICSQVFAQGSAQFTKEFNLDFENGTSGQLPDGWVKAPASSPNYNIAITAADQHGGKQSLFIEQTTVAEGRVSGSTVRYIPAKYIGKQIELKAYLKFQDVTNLSGLIIVIYDENNQILQSKNLQTQRLTGTRDWQQYGVKVFLPPGSQSVMIGAVLNGTGKLWVDDMQLLIDDKDITLAPVDPDFDPNPPKRPRFGENTAVSGRVKLKDADIYYETYGSGEPLLLLHGNSQMIYAFLKQIPAFEKKYKVIAVDTRGQGKSKDFSTGPLSYDLFADDMRQLMDSLHIKKANILGWSDGGNTGLIMAVKYPQYVNKLAVMGANLFPTNEALPDTVLNEVKRGIEMFKTRTDERSKMQARLFTMLITEPQLTFADIAKIKAPTLVMAGETDLILEKHTKAIAAGIKKSKLVIFKGASHYAPVEIVREFNTTVMQFFDTP